MPHELMPSFANPIVEEQFGSDQPNRTIVSDLKGFSNGFLLI
jgi:hypothetical protein